MSTFHNIADWLVIFGGLYLGTLGLNMKPSQMLGIPTEILRVFYVIVGVSSLYLLISKWGLVPGVEFMKDTKFVDNGNSDKRDAKRYGRYKYAMTPGTKRLIYRD